MLECHEWRTNLWTKTFDWLTKNNMQWSAYLSTAMCGNKMINNVLKVYTKLMSASRSHTRRESANGSQCRWGGWQNERFALCMTYTRVQGGKERAPTQLTVFEEDFSKFGIVLVFPTLYQKWGQIKWQSYGNSRVSKIDGIPWLVGFPWLTYNDCRGSKPLATLSPLQQLVDSQQYNHCKVEQFYVFKKKTQLHSNVFPIFCMMEYPLYNLRNKKSKFESTNKI